MLSKAEEKILEQTMKTLRSRGYETFEEMILYMEKVTINQKELIDKLGDKIDTLLNEKAAADQELEEAKQEIKSLREENEDMQHELFEAEDYSAIAEPAARQQPYYTITFNGNVSFGHVESNYHKEEDSHNDAIQEAETWKK